ncbi:class A beta-lactamase-related serine hydrolase [Paenibacillus nanensis]|uniref:Class A beta-lactamase-related serine hydrolase n=1 Tax=Paenibacillus nanensis TaxID=393251 RepID=A0A3A1V817_9BACL|nr:serine hydrolase domain-containing protein [Paenibacillus nanensis]RIX53570.1 class A beta-lactamase-related serine hydrolase [Paenibacillus nanensis]
MTTQTKLANYLHTYRERYPLSGTVLIAQNGSILYEEAFGNASEEHQVPNTMDTKFGIWSVTKSFTAMAIMMLAEQGLLRLDDPAGDYLPSLKSRDSMSIRQLLQHRSGLPNFTSMPEYNADWNKWPAAKETVLERLADKPNDFLPGTAFAYNNTGYYLLGVIVEAVTGSGFEDFLRLRILQPLDMRSSGINNGRCVIPGLASAYSASNQTLAPAEYIDMSTVISAGGMYSTARDLLKWDQALYSDTLVGRSVIEDVFSREEEGYGLGWFLNRKHDRRRIYHGGAYRGYRSELHRYPDERMTVILLSNYDFVPVTRLVDHLSGIVFGEDAAPPVPPSPYPIAEAELAPLLGRYEGYGCQAIVDRDEEDIYFVWNNRERNPIYPISETSFQHKYYDLSYSFKKNHDGLWTFLGMKKQP